MSNIIEITDFSQPELDAYARLTEAQLRNRLEPEKGIFIAESTKVIGKDRPQTSLPDSRKCLSIPLTGQFSRISPAIS